MVEKKLIARDVVFVQVNKYTNVMSITLTKRLRDNKEFILKEGDSVTLELYDDGSLCGLPIAGGVPALPDGAQ
jgi:membrane protein involved in colicin uptake